MSNVRAEFEFLNRLRESGETNMFGASPYLACAFDIPQRQASKVLVEWINWVNEEPSRVNL